MNSFFIIEPLDVSLAFFALIDRRETRNSELLWKPTENLKMSVVESYYLSIWIGIIL